MSDRAKYWRRLVAAWEKSGLTQAEFCRRRGVKAVTFAWWKRKLNRTTNPGRRRCGQRSASGSRDGQGGFVEVALPLGMLASPSTTPATALAGSCGYEISLPSGSLIRLPGDFDPDKVSQLLRVVASAC